MSIADRGRTLLADALLVGWEWTARRATMGPRSVRARRFRRFGDGTALCFPPATLFGEEHIEIGERTIIGPQVTLSAGVEPFGVPFDRPFGRPGDAMVRIGDDCVIGRRSGIVAHGSITIGDGVFTGHDVYITDANHGYEDLGVAIGRQFGPTHAVRIGDGSWIGHGAIVLPGADIGRHVVIGAGAVVTGTVPDHSVAVGNPARVVRRMGPDGRWCRVDPDPDRAELGRERGGPGRP